MAREELFLGFFCALRLRELDWIGLDCEEPGVVVMRVAGTWWGGSLFAGLGAFLFALVRVGFGVEGGSRSGRGWSAGGGGGGGCGLGSWLLACCFWHVMGGYWRCWRVDGVMGRDYGRVV